VRFAICFFMALALPACLDGAYGQPSDESLRIYAVDIVQDAPQSWTGHGVYLGNGMVITAAHVVGSASRTKPRVRIANLLLPAHAIKEGSFEKVDLTALSIDEEKLPVSMRMRRMPLCRRPPWPGEPVIVAVPESTARSRIISPLLIPRDLRARFSTVISDVATTGNSGSGVFDADRKCLLGIRSAKIFGRPKGHPQDKPKDIAKYFVAASKIRAFIPTEYRDKVASQ
jgi:S1-C subfamily serine protease